MRLILLFVFAWKICLWELPLEGHGHHHDSGCHHEEEFHWTREKNECANVLVQVAGPGVIQNYVQVSGKIVVHPDSFAYVIPKVGGTVWEIRKNIGDRVLKEEILALVESQEMAEAKMHYLASQKKAQFYNALLKKEEMARGISAGQDYLNAKWAATEASIQLDGAKQSLYAIGLDDEEIAQIEWESPRDLRFYKVKAPLCGTIVESHLALGEMGDSASKIFAIADFDKVWVEMSVPQKDVPYLKPGLPVEIVSAADRRAKLQLAQFIPVISEETRSARAIALIENGEEGGWTPGEFVTIQIETNTLSAPIVVPREAVQKVKGESVIFVENASEFVPRVVKLGRMDHQNVEILSGLNEGDTYAAGNTFCMKAELQKEEAEHSH